MRFIKGIIKNLDWVTKVSILNDSDIKSIIIMPFFEYNLQNFNKYIQNILINKESQYFPLMDGQDSASLRNNGITVLYKSGDDYHVIIDLDNTNCIHLKWITRDILINTII